MPIIDAYAHVSLPRFLSAEEFLWVMDENDIDACEGGERHTVAA